MAGVKYECLANPDEMLESLAMQCASTRRRISPSTDMSSPTGSVNLSLFLLFKLLLIAYLEPSSQGRLWKNIMDIRPSVVGSSIEVMEL